MQARTFGSRWRLGVGGTLLCVLAALFAVEAKVAWYSPGDSSLAQISAAKLELADAPELIAQLRPLPAVLHRLSAEPISILAVATPAAPGSPSSLGSGRNGRGRQNSPEFSPHLFRRPPPLS